MPVPKAPSARDRLPNTVGVTNVAVICVAVGFADTVTVSWLLPVPIRSFCP
jgi:hypothetical protein